MREMRRCGPAGAIALLALSGWACAGAPHVERARGELARGDPEAAERAAADGLEKDPDDDELWRVRVRAAAEAGERERAADLYRAYARRGGDDPRVLGDLARAALARATEHPDPDVRARAVRAIEDRRVESLAPRVFALLRDDADEVAATAAVAVLRGHRDAPGVAAAMLESEHARARAIATAGVARKVGPASRPEIEPKLEDDDPEVRAAAVTAIAAWGERRDSWRLLAAAHEDGDPRVRAAALRALGEGERSGAAAAAVRGVADEAPEVRRAAAYALAELEHARGLRLAARAPDPAIALRAGAALWRLGEDDADGLGRGLRAANPSLRKAALAEIARSAPGRHGLRAAGYMLVDPDPGVRLAAGRALLELGVTERAVAELASALEADDEALRAAAATELARIGDERGARSLAELAAGARDPSAARRAARGHAVAGILSPGLAVALASERPGVRVAAARAALAVEGASRPGGPRSAIEPEP